MDYLKKKTSLFDEYIGKWVIIFPNGRQENFSGLLRRIEDNYAVLNPFQGGKFDAKTGLTRKLIKKDSLVYLGNGVNIEPTTEESVRAYCAYSNRQAEKKNSEGKKE